MVEIDRTIGWSSDVQHVPPNTRDEVSSQTRLHLSKPITEPPQQPRDDLSQMLYKSTVFISEQAPAEILSVIFKIVAAEDTSPYLRRITHVCRRWRYISIGDPRLWTHIPMRHANGAFGRQYLWTRFHRSLNQPLSIDCSEASFHPEIVTQYRRVERLTLSGLYPSRALFYCFTVPWTALTRLEIRSPMDPYDITKIFARRKVELPCLQSLVLVGVPWKPYLDAGFIRPTLRSLEIIGYSQDTTLKIWLAVLAGLPLLKKLTIIRRPARQSIDRDMTAPFPQSSVTLSLPCLRQLKMNISCPAELQLFSSLKYEKDPRVTILVHDEKQGGYLTPLKFLVHALDVLRNKGEGRLPDICAICGNKERGSIYLSRIASSQPRVELQICQWGYGENHEVFHVVFSALSHHKGLSEITSLRLPLDYAVFVADIFCFMKNVQELVVPHLSKLDNASLCKKRFNQAIQLPRLEHLTVRLPNVYSYARYANKIPALVDGVVDFLTVRTAKGQPINVLSLDPWAQLPELMEKIKNVSPEVVLRPIVGEI